MTLINPSPGPSQREGVTSHLVFQIEVLTNSQGEREICHVECDPTNDGSMDEFEAIDLGAESWEFIFTVPASFDGSEPVFRKFQRYRLDPDVVVDACAKATAPNAEAGLEMSDNMLSAAQHDREDAMKA